MEIKKKEKEATYPPEYSLADVFVAIKQTQRNPNIGKTYQHVLKEGPKTYKVAVIFEILRQDKSFRHYSLKIESITANKHGWFRDEKKAISLSGKGPNSHGEIASLDQFIRSVIEGHLPDEEGNYHVIKTDVQEGIEKLLSLIRGNSDKTVGFISSLLETVKDAPIGLEELTSALKQSSSKVVENLSIASRFVTYQRIHAELKELVERNPREQMFQDFLKENPWLFGSEYSALLDRRTLVRDQNTDFVLRRTVDGYLEIIEIKRPFKEALFLKDKSHNTYYPSAEVTKVVAQVISYIDRVESQRHEIRSMDSEDPLKIRARIIIGRDGNERAQEALRNYNAHLHRIEIITFDQLVRIGDRVLNIFEEKLAGVEEIEPDDDLPF